MGASESSVPASSTSPTMMVWVPTFIEFTTWAENHEQLDSVT